MAPLIEVIKVKGKIKVMLVIKFKNKKFQINKESKCKISINRNQKLKIQTKIINMVDRFTKMITEKII